MIFVDHIKAWKKWPISRYYILVVGIIKVIYLKHLLVEPTLVWRD
jgi:hypothetical protein